MDTFVGFLFVLPGTHSITMCSANSEQQPSSSLLEERPQFSISNNWCLCVNKFYNTRSVSQNHILDWMKIQRSFLACPKTSSLIHSPHIENAISDFPDLRRQRSNFSIFSALLWERTFSTLWSSSVISLGRSVCRRPPLMENNASLQKQTKQRFLGADKGSSKKTSREIFLTDFVRRLSQPLVIW